MLKLPQIIACDTLVHDETCDEPEQQRERLASLEMLIRKERAALRRQMLHIESETLMAAVFDKDVMDADFITFHDPLNKIRLSTREECAAMST